MNLPILFASGGMVFFGILAIYFSYRLDSLKKEVAQKNAETKRKLYELTVVKELQERIGYSLDVERVVDTLIGSLKNLFPYSTASSIILHEDKYVFKILLEEQVGNTFIEEVRKSMLSTLQPLTNHSLPTHGEEFKTGLLADETNIQPLASFFHVPLTVNGKTIGLMSICSTKPGLYKKEDMDILYQLTSSASHALSRLQEIIMTEQEKILSMIGSLADGILMIDSSYKLTLINQAAKNLLGIPHLSNPTIFDAVNMLSKQYDFGVKIKEALSQGQNFEEKELELADKTVQVILTPVFGLSHKPETSEKQVMGVTVLIHDITLEKSLLRMKEDFTNAVVHELRSPLTAIKTAAEMMEQNEHLEQSQHKLAVIIDEQCKRLLHEINTLLDAAKMEAGNFTVVPTPTDITRIISESVELFSPESEKKQVKIVMRIEDNLPQALADASRIDQVLNNLISNSLKFTPPGGEITIKAASQYNPQLPHTPTNPGLLISVKDSGMGIPLDKQQLLFHKFYQVRQQASANPTEGTGLGLYITKGIIEAHGGNVYINSTPQEGTTIFFTLPVAQQEKKMMINPKFEEVLERYTPQVVN